MLFESFSQFKGELAALSAACLWAIASIVYSRVGQQITPLMLNFAKGVIAIAMILLTLWLQAAPVPVLSPMPLMLLLLSGAIGIGFGDTFYFRTLNCLGPRRTLLMEALAPPLSAFLALIFLQEQLKLSNWLGIVLTVAGVTWVVSEQSPHTKAGHQPKQLLQGLGYGLLAAIGQAGGAVLSRSALLQSDISPLWSTLVRLTAGVAVLFLWLLQQRIPQSSASLPKWTTRNGASVIGAIVFTAFASTYLGIWLQQMSLKFTATGIAQALSATSPLFVLPLVAWMGETISLRAVLGVLIALVGVSLLFGV
jgi:drug/metabolite transporter (DMT)-like permease